MINVLQIRETPKTKCGGIDANCRAIESAFADDRDVNVLPVIDFPMHNMRLLGRKYIASTDISKAIKECDPDVVHIHGSYSFTVLNSIKAAVKHKKKIVYSPHFHPFYALNNPFGGKIFFYLFIKPFLKFVDVIITINYEDTEWFMKFHNKVIRIPHWSKVHTQKMNVVEKKENMILFVGRIDDPVKGIEHIYSLPEGLYDIHCVGKGTVLRRSDITQHINISEESLIELYSSASLLVVPSRYEAFSFVSVEALSCNTPIVASDRVRITDYFKPCQYVSTFRYGDFDEFLRAVKGTIGKPVDKKYVSELFNHESLKQLYKSIYSEFNCEF